MRKKGSGEGSLKIKVIGGERVWLARWVWYDANRKQRRPERIIGTVKQFPNKRDARAELNRIMAEANGATAAMPKNPTFGEVWKRYVTMKTPSWSKANRSAVTSIFTNGVLPAIGARDIAELTPEPLQAVLNYMAQDAIVGVGKDLTKRRNGYSESAVKKALRYMSAVFEFAIGENLITKNPTRKHGGAKAAIEIPQTRATNERFYSLEEVRKLLAVAEGRERLILRLLIICGLRPAEVFALKSDDIEPGRLRINEALKDLEKGKQRIGTTKTEKSDGYVALSEDLEAELHAWASTRKPGLLFTTGSGTTWRIGNYLKRVLKPLAASVGIEDVTHQAFRRTFATHFEGTVKDTQTQMRHARPETTLLHYQKQLPESLSAAVEAFDTKIKGAVN